MHTTNFKTYHLNEKQKIKLKTIQNIKEQKVQEYNNDSNITLSQTPKKNNYNIYVYVQPHTHTFIYIHIYKFNIYIYIYIISFPFSLLKY